MTTYFPEYNGHCGPTAITHLVRMYGNRYGVGSIKNKTISQLFKIVADIGMEKHIFWNGQIINGTIFALTNQYLKAVFDHFGVNTSINGRYKLTYDNVKISLSSNRLMYVGVMGHATYGNHALAGYAYTRLQSSQTGWFKTYLKVVDGWVTGAKRYIDLASVPNDTYWEITFK